MNKKYTIAMLISNGFRPDPRVSKEALSLYQAGYRVYIVCWDRLNEYSTEEDYQGVMVHRVKIRSKYRAGTRQLFYLPRFWIKAFQLLRRFKPNLIHCHDLDTALPGALFSYLYKIPWIFDAHECYPEQIKQQVSRPVYMFLKWLERFMAIKAKCVITVGEILANHFHSFGVQSTIIGNYPNLENYHDNFIDLSRQKLGIPEDVLVISYIGGFTQARAIMPLIQGANMYDNVYILLAGDGSQRKQIEEEIKLYSNIRYMGWIDPTLVPLYMSLSDIIYYGLYKSDGNSQYSAPNTLFTSMAAGKPILTTDVGEIAEIVKKENCGIVIQEATPGQINQGIGQLRNPQIRNFLGANGKKLALEKYNWKNAQEKLIGLYENILYN
jgi:glycosyltransferase involved in cell wall biosynthesis